MDNQQRIQRAFRHDASSSFAGWLPLYHDMGLVGNVLQPLYVGIACTLMSPFRFLERPMRWLEAISRYGATTSGGPNFAYDLCLRRVDDAQLANLDLSKWRVAFNGSERVRAQTLAEFSERFERCGFRRSALLPCYGLAECTLFVSGKTAEQSPRIGHFRLTNERALRCSEPDEGRSLVSCGTVDEGLALAIVDPESRQAVAAGRIGEIWLSGDSVASGYWERPHLTESVFRATLAGQSEPCFLRSGDLGFLDQGELFVCGRLKDLVVARGRNHFPDDLEATVQACGPELRRGSGAAFAIEVEGVERLVIVQELSDPSAPRTALRKRVRKAVVETHGIAPYEIVFVGPRTLPKTSSGKIQRAACRLAYLEGRILEEGGSLERSDGLASGSILEVAGEASADSYLPRVVRFLTDEIARLLSHAPEAISSRDSLASLGLDSMGAFELKYQAETALGVELPLTLFLEDLPLEEIAEIIASRIDRARGVDATEFQDQEEPEDCASVGQEGLWFQEQLEPGSAALNVPLLLRIRGPLDWDRLRGGVTQLARRHDVLRGSLSLRDGILRREVDGLALPSVERADVSGLGRAECLRVATAEAWRPFDLGHEAPLRVRCFSRGTNDHLLLLVFHHVAVDFRSIEILLDELDLLCAGRSIETSPPRYGDYVRWQKRLLEGPVGERMRDYWMSRLKGEIPRLELAGDLASADERFESATQMFSWDASLTGALDEFARANGATLYTVLVSGFVALLRFYTGQDDFVVGTVASGRTRRELRDLVGFLANPVALRVELAGRASFVSVLERMKEEVLGALENQDYPFRHVIADLQGARDVARQPLFDVLFVFQQIAHVGAAGASAAAAVEDGGTPLPLGPWSAEAVPLLQRRTHYDVSLSATHAGHRIVGRWEYRRARFTDRFVQRLSRHFEALMREVLARPRAPLRTASLLGGADRAYLRGWNRTERRRTTQPALLHQLFEARAREQPDRVAILHGESVVRYGELNARANRLARHLRELGVGAEHVVGVQLARTPALVVGLLAVLKAGAAYLPLDPGYPQRRLAFMAKDAQAKVLVTTRALASLSGGSFEHAVLLDDHAQAIAARDESDPEPVAWDESVAYVLYTSGSTGSPKGVAIEHRNARALIAWARGVYDDESLSRVLAATSSCFDLSVFEIFVPLSWGGAIVLVDGALELAELDSSAGVTLVNTVPSALSELVRADALPRSVRTVNVAGEPLTRDLADRVAGRSHVEQFFNLYGPTEATTYATFARLAPAASVPPIGAPLDNTEIRILDRDGRPAPIGAIGELCIVGAHVARGYLGRAAETAARFVPDPEGRLPGARMYRTGDLARLRDDGNLEFVRRIDHQVKVRGFRIELEEVDATLREYPGVRQAAAVVRRDAAGDPALAAFFVREEGAAVDRDDLERHLRARLPSFSVPKFLSELDALPATPSGKVDRARLAEPVHREAGTSDRSAGSQLERRLAAIWCRVLGHEGFGLRDNFFEVGGDSLKLLRVREELGRDLARDVPVNVLFRYPTLSSLARFLGSDDEHLDESSDGRARAERQRSATRRIQRASAREKRDEV
jgi:amino acid adenylation domain-containing protein